MSSARTPWTRSSVSTRSALWFQNTSGTYRSGEFAKLRRIRLALAPSRCRSSSLSSERSSSATISCGRVVSGSGPIFSASRAMLRNSDKSCAMRFSMPGRNTLTTTARPSGSSAACTCATDADASGVRSKLRYNSARGRPSASATIASDCSPGNGATRSCNCASASAMSAGSKSRRVESTCPNFTNNGPSCCNASRKRSPRGNFATSPRTGTNGLNNFSQRASGVSSSNVSRR